MVLDFNLKGALVLKEVTEEAWAYIKEERIRTNASPEHWIFGHENYDGTVYVTIFPEEDKTEIVRITDKLITEYGLKIANFTVHVLLAWRSEAAYAWYTERQKEREGALERQLRALKGVLRNGCKSCLSFKIKRCGDDEDGYCVAGEEPKLLNVSCLNFEDGEDKEGVRYMGSKYFPHKDCEFLKEEIKI